MIYVPLLAWESLLGISDFFLAPQQHPDDFITHLSFVSAAEQAPDAATRRMNQRKEMLQRYKEEKELRKLQEQREKAKKGVFKVGLYRPPAPGFLALAAEEPAVAKPKEKESRVMFHV